MEQNSILHTTLSLDSDIPLYAQLVGIIKRSISTGALPVGALLPSEAELCRCLSISRNTVRQAIGELEDEGLVVRKRGRGTFVADPATKPTVCEKMELREGTPVYCFTRVRNVDGEPLILETSYYPQYIYPNLTRDMLQTHSFYSLLYHVGIVPFAADESYEAVILDDSCAALLGVPSGSCAFFHQRLTRTEDGRIYEYTRSYIRGDRVRLDVHMQKSGMNFVRTID